MSASAERTRTGTGPELVSPILRTRRALDYWHKHGKFPFDHPNYDRTTGLVTVTRAPMHQRTHPQAHASTSTLVHSALGEVASCIHKDYTLDRDLDEGSDTSSATVPYYMKAIVRADDEDRTSLGITPKDYGTRWQSAYREMLGSTPLCGAGDHRKAGAYWQAIVKALELDGQWTPAERNRLRLMEKKWRKRAEGEDLRFEVVGNGVGGMTEEQKREYRDRKRVMEMTKR